MGFQLSNADDRSWCVRAPRATYVVPHVTTLCGLASKVKDFKSLPLEHVAPDATLVRLVPVPALMALFGSVNRWLPAWLERMGLGIGD